MIAATLGGIGIFLLGMILMTDGLKQVAGDSLRKLLARFTGGPLSALMTGAVVTAVVQSSSATTLTTIGFVSAGLLSFKQAVGVIFGANLGTTSTSWIVSLLGLKLNITSVALPLVGVGALLKLLGKGRLQAAGMALAGFGLIFIGIDTLQQGMSGLAGRIDPSSFPAPTIVGRLLLVLMGVLMTVVMQSSSAAAATTLTALSTGTIDLNQAAALVIGQNLGTTVTAGVASIGGSLAARRTALAHILFNGITGLIAFLILPLFVRLADMAADSMSGGGDDTVSLAAFHTAFNLLGVLMLLPVIGRFSAWIERVLPEPPRLGITRHLDATVAQVPQVAVEAVLNALREVHQGALTMLRARMAGDDTVTAGALEEALAELRRFLAQVQTSAHSGETHERHLAALHIIDHLERLVDAIQEQAPGETVRQDDALATLLEGLCEDAFDAITQGQVTRLAERAAQIAQRRREERRVVLARTAEGDLSPDAALNLLEATRWVDRLGYHTWRATHYLIDPHASSGVNPSEAFDGVDVARAV